MPERRPRPVDVRVDSALANEFARRKGGRKVVMRGRALDGYFHVDKEVLSEKGEFDFWVKSALAYNKRLHAED